MLIILIDIVTVVNVTKTEEVEFTQINSLLAKNQQLIYYTYSLSINVATKFKSIINTV